MTKSNFVDKFSKLGLALTTITAISIATSNTANAATLLQDNFNTENGGIGRLNYNNFANWDVENGTVDLIGNSFYNFFPSSGLFLDTDGSTRNAGRITSKTTFTFNPGDVVNLSFNLAGSQRGRELNSVIVSLGSLLNETFTLPANQGLTNFTRTINVASLTNANLAFEGVGRDNVGLILDEITLSRTVSIPEPSAWLGVLALGALDTVSVSKRQRQKLKAKA